MTKQEVEGLLPEVLATAREWVTSANLPRHADGSGGADANPNPAVTAALLQSTIASRATGAN
jgi:hypothetical protein